MKLYIQSVVKMFKLINIAKREGGYFFLSWSFIFILVTCIPLSSIQAQKIMTIDKALNFPDSVSKDKAESFVQQFSQALPIKKNINVVYFLDSSFCYKCVASEIENGWLVAPQTIRESLGLHAFIFDNTSGVQKKLSKPLPSGFVIAPKGIPSDLTRLSEYAAITDSSGTVLLWYRIGKTTFQSAYKLVDSLIAHHTKRIIDSSTIASKVILFPKNITTVTSTTFRPSRVQFFYANRNEVWLCNAEDGSMIRHDILHPTKKICLANRYGMKDYEGVYYTSDSTAKVFYIYHYDPIDTVLFNKERVLYKETAHRLDCLRGEGLMGISDSMHAISHSQLSDLFIQSITVPSVGWRTSIKEFDTTSTFTFRRDRNSHQIDSIVLPIALRPQSHKHCVAFDSTLWWFTSTSELHRLLPSKRIITATLSYPLHPQIAYTYSDGETISVVSDNGLERTLVGYSRIGIRNTPVIRIPQGSIGYISNTTCTILLINPESLQWELRRYSL